MTAPYSCRTYNPIVHQNENSAISEIKQMLMSRNISDQSRAINYLNEILKKSLLSSDESHSQKVVDFFLEADICVFLCNSIASLNWEVLRDVICCLKYFLKSIRFYKEDHASYAVSAILRSISFYIKNKTNDIAIHYCLYFVSQIFYNMTSQGLPSLLSTTTMFNADQIFELLSILPDYLPGKSTTYFISSLLIHSILMNNKCSSNMIINYKSVEKLSGIIEKWLPLLCNTMNDLINIMNSDKDVQFFGVICHIGIECIRNLKQFNVHFGYTFSLCQFLKNYNPNTINFVQKVISTDDDMINLRIHVKSIAKSVYITIIQIVTFTKQHIEDLKNKDYETFLKFLYMFLTDSMNLAILPSFSELLVTSGYLDILPKTNFSRTDKQITNLSILNLCEVIGQLSREYLSIEYNVDTFKMFVKDLQYGVKEICNNRISIQHTFSTQIEGVKSYTIVIYLYFYCLSVENPQEIASRLLPYLVHHMYNIPKSYCLPVHITKCLWLVFAMSCLSNTKLCNLEEKVMVCKATGRLVNLIQKNTHVYYTHHPSIILWCFTNNTNITHNIQYEALACWLEKESYLLDELVSEPIVQYILLEIVHTSKSVNTIENTTLIIKKTMHELMSPVALEEFSSTLWNILPDVFTKFLVNSNENNGNNLKGILELCTEAIPEDIDMFIYQKLSILTICTILKYKQYTHIKSITCIIHYCLNISLQLIQMAKEFNHTNVFMIFTNRIEFTMTILSIVMHEEDKLSMPALKLLSYAIHYYGQVSNTAKVNLELDIKDIILVLANERNQLKSHSFLQFIYTILNNLSCLLPTLISISENTNQQQETNLMKALMFRLQMYCCKDSMEQSSNGWKTLNILLKYATNHKQNDHYIIALITQPWTHTLIHYQLEQSQLCLQFLIFIKNWLWILKVVLRSHLPFNICDTHNSIISTNVLYSSLYNLEKVLSSLCLKEQHDDVINVTKIILTSISDFFTG